MRALVNFKQANSKKKTTKSLYMRFKDRRAMNSFVKRAKKLGYDIKIYTHLGW